MTAKQKRLSSGSDTLKINKKQSSGKSPILTKDQQTHNSLPKAKSTGFDQTKKVLERQIRIFTPKQTENPGGVAKSRKKASEKESTKIKKVLRKASSNS